MMSPLPFSSRFAFLMSRIRSAASGESSDAQTPSGYLALGLEYAELATCQTLQDLHADRLAALLERGCQDDSFALLMQQIDARLFEPFDAPQTLAHQKAQVAIVDEFILNDVSFL